jgi:hypothetical protein
MIYVDLNLHGQRVATWEFKTLTRALASQNWIVAQVRKAELRGIDWAKVRRVEAPGYLYTKTDGATLRFNDGTVSA